MNNYLKRSDILIYIICFLLAAFSLIRIKHLEVNDNFSELDLEKLGYIIEQKNITKRKQIDSIVWENVYDNNNLYSGDKVFTKEDSSASLNIGKKSRVDLSQLTLMQLNEKKSGDLALDLIDGVFVLDLNQTDKIQNIKLKDTKITPTQNSIFKADVSDEDGYISVYDGELNLTRGNQKVALKRNQFTKFKKGSPEIKILNAKFNLTSPKLRENIILSKNEFTSFEWKNMGSINPSKIILKLARDSKFKDIIINQTITKNTFNLNKHLKDGIYFWKLTDNNNDISFTQSFTITNLEPPVLISPTNNSTIFAKEGDGVTFNWHSDLKLTEIQILQFHKDKQNIIYQELTEKKSYQYQRLPIGKYRIKIRSVFNGKHSEWGKPSDFILKNPSPSTIASLLGPKDKYQINLSKTNTIKFSWKGNEDTEYKFQVSYNKDFTNLLIDRSIYSTQTTFKPNSPGEYFWRILSNKGSSQARSFIANSTPPIINIIKNPILTNKEFYQYKFTWEYHDYTNAELQISTTEDFSNVQNFKINTRDVKAKLRSGSKYYLRIKAKDERKSKIQSIIINRQEELSKPKIKDKIRFQIKSGYLQKNIGPYTYYLSPYIANNSKQIENNHISIKWEKNKKAKAYEFILSKNKSFSKIIINQKVKNNFFKWKTPSVGTYYWKIRYITDDNRLSSFSNTSTLIIEREKKKEELPPQKIPYFTQVSPKHNTYFEDKKKYSLSWNSFQKASKYKLILYSDFDKNKIAGTHLTKTLSTTVKFKKGTYHWKIEALDNKNNVIAKTKARKIIVTSPPPIVINKIEEKEKQTKPTAKKLTQIKKKKEKYLNKKKSSALSKFLDRKKNSYNGSYINGGIKPGQYKLSSNLKGSLFNDSEDLTLIASFYGDIGFNYSEKYFFEGSYFYRTAGNSSVTIFDQSIGAFANTYYKNSEKFNILYGIGLYQSFLTSEQQSSGADSSININYTTFATRLSFNYNITESSSHIGSFDFGYGLIGTTSLLYCAQYHYKYYYFKEAELTELDNIFITIGGEYFHRELTYQNSDINITNLTAIATIGMDVDI